MELKEILKKIKGIEKKVYTDGRVLIPYEFRRSLGIDEYVHMIEYDDMIIIRRAE